LRIDGEEFDFSDSVAELHTRSYEEIMAGRGFQLEQTKDAISLVRDIRNTRLGGTV
jgi:UDP-N-acetyl-2-amino-2-deoxyglucuronate dehydrogenase